MLKYSTDIEISRDQYWVVLTIEDANTEQIPQALLDRLPKTQIPLHTIRVLAPNLVWAKVYKDYIEVELLKLQAAKNKRMPYGSEDFIH